MLRICLPFYRRQLGGRHRLPDSFAGVRVHIFAPIPDEGQELELKYLVYPVGRPSGFGVVLSQRLADVANDAAPIIAVLLVAPTLALPPYRYFQFAVR